MYSTLRPCRKCKKFQWDVFSMDVIAPGGCCAVSQDLSHSHSSLALHFLTSYRKLPSPNHATLVQAGQAEEGGLEDEHGGSKKEKTAC